MPKIDIANVPVDSRTNYPEPLNRAVSGRSRKRLGDAAALDQIGVNLTTLKPGSASSLRHWHEKEDEFVYVIEGTPDVWLDGVLHRLAPGDGVGFPAGTGQSHCFLNNTDAAVRLLVVGERSRADNRYHYPLHPARNQAISEHWWKDVPARQQGPHDGLPDALRESNGPF